MEKLNNKIKPELSIIIISKQEEEYLPRLLESIKSQSFKNYEIILSDAQSTDKTRKIGKTFGCKIVEGGLPSVGRNNGAKIAKREILLFLDADSEMPEGFIEKNLIEFKKRGLVCGTPFYRPNSKNLIDKISFFFYNLWSLIMQYSLPYSGGTGIFVNKIDFSKLNGFDEKMIIAEDNDFIKRIKKIGKFRVINSVPILIDIRRFEKEGRTHLMIKYIYSGIYRLIFGDPYKSIINYTLQGEVKLERGKRIEEHNFNNRSKKK
jgi:glycosyltransferase involved in cell wall biosynthesis